MYIYFGSSRCHEIEGFPKLFGRTPQHLLGGRSNLCAWRLRPVEWHTGDSQFISKEVWRRGAPSGEFRGVAWASLRLWYDSCRGRTFLIWIEQSSLACRPCLKVNWPPSLSGDQTCSPNCHHWDSRCFYPGWCQWNTWYCQPVWSIATGSWQDT